MDGILPPALHQKFIRLQPDIFPVLSLMTKWSLKEFLISNNQCSGYIR